MNKSPKELLLEVIALRDKLNSTVATFLNSLKQQHREKASARLSALLVLPWSDDVARDIFDGMVAIVSEPASLNLTGSEPIVVSAQQSPTQEPGRETKAEPDSAASRG